MRDSFNKSTLAYLPALFAALALAGSLTSACKPKSKSAAEERPRQRGAIESREERETDPELTFDPLSLKRDSLIVAEVYRDSVILPGVADSAGLVEAALDAGPDSTSDSSAAVGAYDTYRIQLFNSRVFTEASLERNVAGEIFDQTATLEYEVPYFKVRIGDFTERKVAEEYLSKFVKPAGYRDSWVTRVRVLPNTVTVPDSALAAYYDSLRNEIFYGETLGVWIDTLDDTVEDDEED
ncbi:MAG: hypothetical protein ACE5GA_03005 [Candidatus Zixiibacteriota bacterium]